MPTSLAARSVAGHQRTDSYDTQPCEQVKCDAKSHTVHHFHYDSWPDHGVPKKDGHAYPDMVLALLEQVFVWVSPVLPWYVPARGYIASDECAGVY